MRPAHAQNSRPMRCRGELKAMEQELKKVSRDKELAISMQNFEEAVRHREEEERLRKLLDESKREWKKNQEKQQADDRQRRRRLCRLEDDGHSALQARRGRVEQAPAHGGIPP